MDVVLRKMQCTVETKVAVVFELVVSLFILCSSRDFCRKSFLLPYADFEYEKQFIRKGSACALALIRNELDIFS